MKYEEPRHPKTGSLLTPLQRELWRLRMVAHECQTLRRGLNRVQGDITQVLNDDIFFILMNHGLILVSKFLEIWDSFGCLEPEDQRVRQVRRAVMPFVDRIRVWRGLGQFRNSALAHPYLTRKGEIIQPWTLIETERAPGHHAEQTLLVDCSILACAGILAAYDQEYAELQPILGSQSPETIPSKGITLGPDIHNELHQLTTTVNKGLEQLGVPPDSWIFSEFKERMHLPPEAAGEAAVEGTQVHPKDQAGQGVGRAVSNRRRGLVVLVLVLLALGSLYYGLQIGSLSYRIPFLEGELISGAITWKAALTFVLPILLGGLAGFVWLGKD